MDELMSEKRTVTISFRVDPALHRELQALCQLEQKSLSTLVWECLAREFSTLDPAALAVARDAA